MRWIKLTMLNLLILLAGSRLILLTSATNHRPAAPLQVSEKATGPTNNWTLYDPDPNHLWNRLYRALYQRVTLDGKDYGYDELDPLLWYQTKYLLINPAYQQASTVLDEFLATHAEKALKDPLKRAILQHDLWSVFDWTTQVQIESREKANLQLKLARVIRSLALSPDEVAKLPDNYNQAASAKVFAAGYDPQQTERPFLPPDLFDPKGSWVQLSGRGGEPIARAHTTTFSGRSVFLIFMRLPEGRDATLKYLTTLAEFHSPWSMDPKEPQILIPNPDLPQFPAGTELALVRTMVLIDNQGKWQPTKLIEDIQIRVHRVILSTVDNSRNSAAAALAGFEFKLSRAKLLRGETGGLRALSKTDTEFSIFASHGDDLFEGNSRDVPLERVLRVPLQSCAACHSRSGVHSMLSRGGRVLFPSWNANAEIDGTKWWKSNQYNWGLLQGLWRSQSNP